MFTVECPECKATYQVDERRVPANGLRMRCPKCSAAFVVQRPDGAAPVASAVSGVGEPPGLPAPRPVILGEAKLGVGRTAAATSVAGGRKPAPPPRGPLAESLSTGAKPQAPPLPSPGKAAPAGAALKPKPPVPPPAPSGLSAPKPAQAQARLAGPEAAPVGDDDLLPQTVQAPPTKASPLVAKGRGATAPRRADATSIVADLPGIPTAKSATPVRQREQPTEADWDQVDLPVVRHEVDSYLPAALDSRAGSPKASPREADSNSGLAALPALRQADLPLFVPARHDAAGLPDVRGAKGRAASFDELELDLPSPTAAFPEQASKSDSGRPSDAGDFEFELPSPLQVRQGALDVGSGHDAQPRRRVSTSGGVDLPELASNLPVVAPQVVGLPNVPGRADTAKKTISGTGLSYPPPASPTPIGDERLPEIDLGFDLDQAMTAQGSSPGSFAPPGSSSLPPPLAGSPSGGSLPPALGETSSRSSHRFDAIGASLLPEAVFQQPHATASSARTASQQFASSASEGVGGTGYGEVRLEPMGREVSVDMDAQAGRRSLTGENLEFGAVPEAVDRPAGPDVLPFDEGVEVATEGAAVKRAGAPPPMSPTKKTVTRRSRVIALAAVAVVGVAGGALSLLPDLGPFGAHFLADQIHRKDNDALVKRHADACHEVLVADDFSGVPKALAGLEAAQREHQRLRVLKACYAFFAYAIELRHGSQPQYRAAAKVILDELGTKTEIKYLGVAAAERAAVEGNLAKARHAIVEQISRDPRSVDALVVSAEISMLERRYSEAVSFWQQIERLEQSARATFGLARAYHALGQYDDAKASAERTISRNADHVGARLTLARVALEKSKDSVIAQRYIAEALARKEQQSAADFVVAETLSGDLHLWGSRISLAEAAYQSALAKDPRSSAALRGLGETLYRAGRYSESLARFEAGLQADPDDVLVAVGVAKAQLALERIRESSTLLSRLRQSSPKNYAVNYWYGKTEEAAGNRVEAEKAYAIAMEAGGTDPVVVDAYVAMALLKNQQGRREEAQKVLATAQEKLPRLPRIFDAIGQLALAEGRYASAIEQFMQARTLDPNDLGVKFRLGTALRKNRNFEDAAKVFDEVTAVDRDYPGLALERGQLYEASGHTEEALHAFESALAKAPTDPDLMLRVGCGKIAAGRPQQAEQLLKKVLEQRPTSAETHHCLGRAQLMDGSNLATALRTLERAVELDPHRAEYHLYVAWAANEAGRVAVAEQALKKALELDQGLGDAYWQRGILRYRQGAVKDAVADLTRALELRPGRYEAHAALADAYFDLGFEPKALEQWRLATVAQPDNATWRFRYGKLLQAAHRDAEARPQLEAALDLASKLSAMPRWAWEAHHLLARAIGQHPLAVKHWEAFLELAPRDNPYRDEAKQILNKLGKPWTRD